MIVKCVECGKEFYSWPKEQAKGEGRFCSRKCYGINHSKSMSGKNHHNWKGGDKELKCKYCGVKYIRPMKAIGRGRGKFCSRSCYGSWLSENRLGDKVPSWKGGITKITHSIRTSHKYSMWRKSVFKRDNWTCQKCGVKSKNIQAHHKLSFKDYPLFRIEINNGITLCKDCHKKEHKK